MGMWPSRKSRAESRGDGVGVRERSKRRRRDGRDAIALRQSYAFVPSLESLEGRRVLAVNALDVGGVLVISMDAAGDQAVLQFDGAKYTVTDGTVTVGTFATATITKGINVDGDSGAGQKFLFETGSTPLAQTLIVGGNVEVATIDSAITNAADVTLQATAITLNADITTTAAQLYTGAVTLAKNTTLAGTTVTNSSKINGGGKSLAITGNAVVNGAISGVTNFSVSGTTALGANVTTTGTQAYTGAVTLSADTTLAGTTVTNSSTITGGGKSLAITGNAAVIGAISGVTNYSVSGTTTLGANVATAGTQTYTVGLTLAADAALQGTTAAFGTGIAGAGKNLSLDFSGGAALSGKTFTTNVNNLTSAKTDLAGTITTTGTQTYTGAVTLTDNVTAASTGNQAIAFSGTVDGAKNLTVTTTGATTFGGVVGGTTALTSLTTDAGGTTKLGANVSTTGAQTYGDGVSLTGDVTAASSTNQAIAFSGTVDGGKNLTVNTTGTTTFGGVVGGTTGLTSLTTDAGGTTSLGGNVSTSGAQTYNDNASLTGDVIAASTGNQAIAFSGTVDGAKNLTVNTAGATTFGGVVGGTNKLTSLTTDAGGTTSLGGNVSTTGAQTYNDNVSLTGDVIAASSTNQAIAFSGTVDGGKNLTVNTTGTTTFGGVVGGTTALTSLTTNAGGTTSLGANVSTTGAQTYNDAVTLTADAVLTGTDPTFGGTVTGGGKDLALNFSGTTTVDGTKITGVKNLATGNGGTTQLTGTITTTGTQTYGDNVMLTGTTTLQSGANAILFSGTVVSQTDGSFGLSVTNTSTTTFTLAVGDGQRLASLTGSAGGTIVVNGGTVTTSGNQAYAGTLSLGANTTLTGATGTFSTINGNNYSLTLNFTDSVKLAGVTINNVSGLIVNSDVSLQGTITAAGNLSFGAVTLLGDTTINASAFSVTFTSTVSGTFGLTVNSAATTAFQGVVGTLKSLTTNAGGRTTIAGPVTTTEAQSFGDDVQLLNNTTLSGKGQTFAGTLNANNKTLALTIEPTGISTLDGNNVANLASLTTSGAGTLQVKGPITSTGSQLYGSKVSLIDDTTLDAAAATITFNAAVDGAKNLTLVTTGLTTFGNAAAIGGVTPLASLTTSALGTTAVTGGTVKTTGNQSYQAGVTFGAATTLSGAAITFADDANAGGNALTATATTGAITANTFNKAISASTLTLSAATGIDVNTTVTSLDAKVTGTGNILVVETNGINLGSATGLSTSAGTITVRAAAGSIQINKAVSAGTGAVTLVAKDGITAIGGITAITAGDLDLTNNTNNTIALPLVSVANVAVTQSAAGTVSINNVGSLGIGVGTTGISTQGSATITANTGVITLNQPSTVAAAATLALRAPAGIIQSASGTLSGAGTVDANTASATGGAVILDAVGNTAANIQGATKAAGFKYFASGNVQVGAIGTQGGAITLAGPTGANIAIAGALAAGTGTVSISTATAAGAITTAGGTITTSTATGDILITTTGGGVIQTPTITATGGDVTITTQSGGGITIANALAAGGGNVSVQTVSGGAIISNAASVTTNGAGTITLQTGTAGSITTGIMTSASGAIALATAGVGAAINTSAGSITTAGGSVSATTGSGGDITLASVTSNGGNQSYTTGTNGNFNSTAGTLSSNGGTITVAATGTGTITAGKILSNGNAIRLEAGSTSATAIKLTDAVSANVSGRITLASAGGISDNAAAVLTANQLVVETANGVVTLNQTGNDIGAIALLNSSAFANKIASRSRSLTVGVAGVATAGIQTANGNVSIDNKGFTIGATATAQINIGSGILSLEAASVSLASTAHQVNNLAAATTATAGITFKGAGDLVVVTGTKATDGSDLVGLSAPAAQITLTAAGKVLQANSGAVKTGSLTISAAAVGLNDLTNDVSSLKVNTDGGVSFTDATALSIAGINGLAGAPNKAAGVSLIAGAGGVAGGISGGDIYAGSLTAVSKNKGDSVSLSGDVDSFAATSGESSALTKAGISFTDLNDVTLGNLLADGTPNNKGFVTVVAGGSITVNGVLTYDRKSPGSLVLQHGAGGSVNFTVSSTSDLVTPTKIESGAAAQTLRQRIYYVNDNAVIAPQREFITFAINNFFPIAIDAPLDTIERKVTVGPAIVSDPDFRIAIDGTGAGETGRDTGGTVNGLTFGYGNAQGLGSNNSLIQGLTIYGFSGSGIVLHSSGNTVTNCWVGITRGSEVKANGVGIDIESTVEAGTTKLASSNTVTSSVISGNLGAGIRLQKQATLTTITNNKIGTNAFGTVPIGNGGYGIDILSSNLTTVGGVNVGNTIVNNALGGVSITGKLQSGSTNLANQVLGNTIANNVGAGVTIDTSLGNVIGSSGAANTISDNNGEGVLVKNARAVSLAAGNLVQANAISLNRRGGVVLENTAFQTVSGGNVITSNGNFATNTGAGIEIRSSAAGNATDNVIAGNFIGTDASAALDGGNAGQGILLTGAQNTLIGSALASDANVIAYNRDSGVKIQNVAIGINTVTATANRVRGNTIRLNGVLGDPGFDIGMAGVRIDGGSKNIVGGANAGEGNTIADNKQAGVLVVGAANASFDAGNRVAGNTIRANELDGVALSGSTFQTIDAANVITGNGRDGISLAAASNNNRILGNRIGIDATGLSAGNERDGIRVDGSTNTTIGDSASANRNVIAANGVGAGGGSGIVLTNKANATTIRNNLIGLNASAAAAGNTGRGISVVGTGANQITGLVIGGTGTNEGNVIAANGLAGVRIEETDGALVRGNRIGTDSAGTLPIGNLGNGVEIVAGKNTDVGGPVATAANVISGNSLSGVSVTGGGTGHLIRGNRIGTNAAGTAAVANLQHGIAVDGGATTVTIGGTALNTPNTIAGNSIDGINVADGKAAVLGNFIGTNSLSSAALANGGDGIQVAGGASTTVGDGTAQGRNVISGNAGRGIYLTGGTKASVAGNYVGTNVAGTAALPNALAGVRIEGVTTAAIGNVNVISGNKGAGIELVGAGTTAASITGNFIGTNAAGLAAVANGGAGVSLTTAGTAGAGNQNVIGGLGVGNGNVIAGNTSHGISATNSTNALIAQNSIGLNAAGATLANGGSGIAITNSTAITATFKNQIAANAAYGVLVSGGSGNFIGADATQTNKGLANGNTITRNKLDGIRIEEGSTGNVVAANTIGAVGQANGGRGITISASNGNTIGGTTAGGIAYGNLVGSNTSDGVGIVDSIAASLATGNKLLGNQVRSNLGRGIVVDNSDFQSVGGTGTGDGNTVVLNSSHGIDLRNDADSNLVTKNFVGTNSSFAGGLGNLASGIRVFGGLSQSNVIEKNRVQANAQSGILIDGAVGNTIGGNAAGNTVVSQGGAGISLVGNASFNTVAGNFVGTDKAGTTGANLGNKADGVSIVSSVGNTVGGANAGDGNTLRFNQVGVSMTGATAASLASGNVVLGNTIDQNRREGVRLFASSFNAVGDTDGAAPNKITRNAGDGIAVLTGSASNLVRGNTVGGATTANANRGAGIRVAGSALNTLAANTVQSNLASGVVVSAASKTTIGGTAAGDANTISSNVGDGILLADNASLSTVQSNAISSNTGNGISVQRSVGNAIGTASAGNTVQKNSLDGILVSSLSANTAVQGNTVGGAGNANAGSGIRVVVALGTLVGGTNADEGNTVGLNSRSGVSIEGVTSRTAAVATRVYGNTFTNTTAGAAISVSASLGQIIGGTDPGQANAITGSKVGVQILAGTTGTTVAGNAISGSTTHGITITASTGNTIGGNTITTSKGDGILIAQSAGKTLAAGNRILSNYIGTDADSATTLGNTGAGIRLASGTSFTTIGAAGQGNVIGKNAVGVSIEGGSNSNVIEANLVGADAIDANLGNTGAGIQITRSLSNVVRGGNTVAFNQTGIRIVDAVAATTAVGNRIEGNTIRTNTNHGVQIAGGGRHTIGGTAAGTANTIVTNGGNGIDIAAGATGGSTGNLVRGNFIGVDAASTADLGNTGSGVSITGGTLNEVAFGNVIANNTQKGIAISASSSNTIGGSTTAAGNTISGNTQNGVSLAAGSSSNLVAANVISGNTQAGISVSGAASQGNVIGVRVVAGAATGLGNTISNNKAGGVVVDAAVRNQIFANLISGNTADTGTLTGPAAGIRLLNGGNAATPAPTIATAAVAGRQLTLTGTIGTTARQQFWVEVYRNGTSGTAQANQPIGRVLVTTRAGGAYTAVLTLANGTFLPAGELLTATATSLVGNTSAISTARALP